MIRLMMMDINDDDNSNKINSSKINNENSKNKGDDGDVDISKFAQLFIYFSNCKPFPEQYCRMSLCKI